jgi:hypothetical protein
MSAAQLKPCPFCGSKAKPLAAFWTCAIECVACKAGTGPHDSIEDAAVAWEKRVEGGPLVPSPEYRLGETPTFSRIASSKLAELQKMGFAISGYSVERTEDNNQVTRGFITHCGLVGWWHPENAEPAAPAWKPEFDAMSPRQEQLVVQFCAEIAGPKGRAGSAPDPVRLLEMAQALYEAEREDAAIDAAQQTR